MTRSGVLGSSGKEKIRNYGSDDRIKYLVKDNYRYYTKYFSLLLLNKLQNHRLLLQQFLHAFFYSFSLLLVQFQIVHDFVAAFPVAQNRNRKAYPFWNIVHLFPHDDAHTGHFGGSHKPIPEMVDDGGGGGEVGACTGFVGYESAPVVKFFLNLFGSVLEKFVFDLFLGVSGNLDVVEVAKLIFGVVAPHYRVLYFVRFTLKNF